MIRVATVHDYKYISRSLAMLDKIDYITDEHVIEDIKNEDCYVLEDCEKIVAIASLVYDSDFNMHYIKRLLVLDLNSHGKGYGKKMMKHMSELSSVIAVTPFKSNTVMKKIVESLGFEYKYTFLHNYTLYVKQ